MQLTDIENLIVEKEKDRKAMLANLTIVEQRKLTLQLEKLKLQASIKELEIAIEKGSHSIKQNSIELSLLTKQFWNLKNELGA
jgi:hypothetical protein